MKLLRDFERFVQFKKREKHQLLVKHATLLKVTLLHGCFSRFLNYADDIKSRKAFHFQTKFNLKLTIVAAVPPMVQ